ncbi:MAG: hypothetical protein V3T31_13510, partial [candidate division Zixibacteria bacterium]
PARLPIPPLSHHFPTSRYSKTHKSINILSSVFTVNEIAFLCTDAATPESVALEEGKPMAIFCSRRSA